MHPKYAADTVAVRPLRHRKPDLRPIGRRSNDVRQAHDLWGNFPNELARLCAPSEAARRYAIFTTLTRNFRS